MSLKWFHVLFITASVVLSVLLGMFAFANGAALWGAASLATGAGLAVYQSRFLRKAREIGLK